MIIPLKKQTKAQETYTSMTEETKQRLIKNIIAGVIGCRRKLYPRSIQRCT